jgi:restriction endonuclease fold toxin 5 of polymorphic toxin system
MAAGLMEMATTARLVAPIAVAATVAVETAASIFGALGRTALSGLADLAAGLAAPTAFLGVLFLPTNNRLVSEGKLPDRPDLGYRYDRDTGILEIYRADAGRQSVLSGRVGTDGLFHDADGRIIGRSLGSTLAIDPDALPAPIGRTGAEARTEAETAKDRPRLCPDPSAESIAGRSERSLAHEEQITGLPRGLEVKLNGVRFDGCREGDGTMLEAKGPGFADKMTAPDDWPEWFTGDEAMAEQMRRQSGAAAGRMVEWHFAEQPVADYFRVFAEQNRLSNIVVLYTPAITP